MSKVTHADIGSLVEFDKAQLKELDNFFCMKQWDSVCEILESIKDNGVLNVLKMFRSTENEIRNAQGACEMIETLLSLKQKNKNLLEEIE